MSKHEKDDRGAALVTVLTMLAVMSALAVIVVDAANMSLRRTANMTRMEQTRWYLMGAENFATARLAELRQRGLERLVDQDEWQSRPFSFPLDDGLMQVSLRDGGNCFNLNSMVITEDSGARTTSALGLIQFSRLLDAVDVHTSQGSLAAALADWIDSDSQPTAGGAEDETYGGEAGAYRTANTLMADVSELRRVRGFTPEIIERLQPYICVRPTTAPNQFNPNTMTPEQGPLLAMAIGDGELNSETAAQIMRDRPRGGWESVDAFLLHPRLSGLDLNDAGRAQFNVQTRYYLLYANVERDQGVESSVALIESSTTNAWVVRRVFGAGGSETML